MNVCEIPSPSIPKSKASGEKQTTASYPAAAESGYQLPKPPAHKLRLIRTLIVDDDRLDQRLVRELLQQADPAMHIESAESIPDALLTLASGEYDIVLLDYYLQDGVLGPQHIHDFRQASHDVHLPVVVLTGQGNEQAVTDSFRDGASDYLSKHGMTVGDLFSALASALEKSDLDRQHALQRHKALVSNRQLAKDKEEAMGVCTNISHELQSPVNTALEQAEWLQRGLLGPLNSQQKATADLILHSCERAQHLVEGLRDAAAIRSGKLKLFKSSIDISKTVYRCVEGHVGTAGAKGLAIKVETGSTLPLFNGDAVRLEQLLSNLLDNAIKFTRKPGTLRVLCALDARQKYLTISVKDHGCGIYAEDCQQIFEPFYQVADDVSTQPTGLGLGLHLSKQIVELHGGQLIVQSEPEIGSQFTAIMPMVEQASITEGVSNEK